MPLAMSREEANRQRGITLAIPVKPAPEKTIEPAIEHLEESVCLLTVQIENMTAAIKEVAKPKENKRLEANIQRDINGKMTKVIITVIEGNQNG